MEMYSVFHASGCLRRAIRYDAVKFVNAVVITTLGPGRVLYNKLF